MATNGGQTGHIDSASASTETNKRKEICLYCQKYDEPLGRKKIVWLGCSTCESWWHSSCAGLDGLTVADVKKLKVWNCYFCFNLPESLKFAKLTDDVAKELKSVIQTAVSTSVEQSIQKVLVKDVVAEANKKIHKSWAEIASGQQKKLIAEVCQHAAGPAITTISQQIDANMQERKKRENNIVLSNLPDEENENESEEQLKAIISRHATDLNQSDILSAKRIGVFGNVNRTKYRGRMVIAKLKSEELATYMHNHGRGFAYHGKNKSNDVWINPDLIKADRDIRWNTRNAKLETDKKTKITDDKPPKEEMTTPNKPVITGVKTDEAKLAELGDGFETMEKSVASKELPAEENAQSAPVQKNE